MGQGGGITRRAFCAAALAAMGSDFDSFNASALGAFNESALLARGGDEASGIFLVIQFDNGDGDPGEYSLSEIYVHGDPGAAYEGAAVEWDEDGGITQTDTLSTGPYNSATTVNVATSCGSSGVISTPNGYRILATNSFVLGPSPPTLPNISQIRITGGPTPLTSDLATFCTGATIRSYHATPV